MADIHQSPVILYCFAEQVNSACKVINHSFTAIPQMFKDKEICITYYQHKEYKDKVIEIVLGAVVLTCAFDENDVCISASLFTDDRDNMKPYIDYCNKVYEYSYLLGGWLIEKYYLHIKSGEDGYFFALLPLPPLRNIKTVH